MTMLVAQPGKHRDLQAGRLDQRPAKLDPPDRDLSVAAPGPTAPVYILGSANFPWKDSKFESISLPCGVCIPAEDHYDRLPGFAASSRLVPAMRGPVGPLGERR